MNRMRLWRAGRYSLPLGKKSAASLPVFWAESSSRRLMLGSSPNTSSPTSAAAIARRMDSVGWVMVSLLRSMDMAVSSTKG